MKKVELSIIAVSYNSEKYISNLLTSLEKHKPNNSEIIVVDNKSQDGTIDTIKRFKFVKLIENDSNLGFSVGNNIGANIAVGETLLFINQDVEIKDNSIQILREYLEQHPDVGILAPKLIDLTGRTQESVSKFPTLWGVFKEYFFKQKHSYSQYAPNFDDPIEVDVVYGAGMMILTQIFKNIGGFDERYFLFYEDIDLCQKINKLDLKVVYLPSAKFYHQIGASMKKADKMPFGIRTLSWFMPIKSSGSRYYMIQSARIYHGILVATLIRILMYFGVKILR